MRRQNVLRFLLSLLAACPLALACGGVSETDYAAGTAALGNGAPSGAHFNLNLIGMAKTRSADLTGDEGHRIFLPLRGSAKIRLTEGPSFLVTDANGTDGKAAFQLPNPDPDGDGLTAYSVWVRALGKPGGSLLGTTCASDQAGLLWCSQQSLLVVRGSGRSLFSDVSDGLLRLQADLDGDGVAERHGLFDADLQDWLWSLESNGLRLAQLRFYEVPAL